MTPPLSRARLTELLDRARGKRVLVIGDAMLDVYLIGDVERISPEAPVPVVRVRHRSHALGGAANVAQNVVAIGASCRLVATVGGDRAGETLRLMLRELGAEEAGLVTIDRATTQKTRIIARSQQLARVDEEEDADLEAADVEALMDRIRSSIEATDAVVIEDYNKGVLVPAVITEIMRLANDRSLPVVVDPKYRNFFLYRGAAIFKPNRRELEAAVGATVDLDHPTAMPSLLEKLGARHLLLTLGERGMLLASGDGSLERVPTVAREVYDVVGAGDTVTAYLATMLAANATALEAAVIANVAAGIEVGKLGAASVSRDELVEYVDAHTLHV
jgi:D-beta-D-heptose 7-phosphate kinase/D-beta-D-heptose 1-phosphate adenosyltransferase